MGIRNLLLLRIVWLCNAIVAVAAVSRRHLNICPAKHIALLNHHKPGAGPRGARWLLALIVIATDGLGDQNEKSQSAKRRESAGHRAAKL